MENKASTVSLKDIATGDLKQQLEAEEILLNESHSQKKFVGLPVAFEIAPTRIAPDESSAVKGFGFELQFEDVATGAMDFMRGAVEFKTVPPSPQDLAKAFRALADACDHPFDSPHIAIGEQELTELVIKI